MISKEKLAKKEGGFVNEIIEKNICHASIRGNGLHYDAVKYSVYIKSRPGK